MLRTTFITSIAGAALIAAVPALAAPGGNGGGNGGGNSGGSASASMGGMNSPGADMRDTARANSQGSINASDQAIERANQNSAISGTTTGTGTTRTRINPNVSGTTRANSQGAAHANINGLAHASPRSALSSAGVTTLTGLTTGLTVNNSAGTSVGTVSNVILNRSGAVVGVQVNLTGGGTVTLPATSLSMDGTTVITSSTAVGG